MTESYVSGDYAPAGTVDTTEVDVTNRGWPWTAIMYVPVGIGDTDVEEIAIWLHIQCTDADEVHARRSSPVGTVDVVVAVVTIRPHVPRTDAADRVRRS